MPTQVPTEVIAPESCFGDFSRAPNLPVQIQVKLGHAHQPPLATLCAMC